MLNISEASTVLHSGGTLAYPTEAVWGLGCDPYNELAFKKILALKERPIEKGVILLASSIEQVEPLLDSLNSKRRDEIIQSWQSVSERATTWLLPVTSDIPRWIIGQHTQVAVRVTQHTLCKALCNEFGHFIVSTSANPAGLSPATNLEKAKQYFGNRTEYLDGKLGTCQEPSRIIDAITGQVIRG